MTAISNWTELKKRLDFVVPPNHRVLPVPNEAILDAFEQRRQIKLPRSYRSFAKHVGAGMVSGYFGIAVPGYPGRKLDDLDRFDAYTHELKEVFVETFGDAEQFDRFLFFAKTFGGDYIAWDPADVRNRRSHEYGIYVLPRDEDKILFLAKSFLEFVTKVCLGKRWHAVIGGEYRPPKFTFEPVVEKIRRKGK
ncbi:MAG: SMI1/KNR4 family protein [Gemmataceae bacterium]